LQTQRQEEEELVIGRKGETVGASTEPPHLEGLSVPFSQPLAFVE
jgi:hypothetical protein